MWSLDLLPQQQHQEFILFAKSLFPWYLDFQNNQNPLGKKVLIEN